MLPEVSSPMGWLADAPTAVGTSSRARRTHWVTVPSVLSKTQLARQPSSVEGEPAMGATLSQLTKLEVHRCFWVVPSMAREVKKGKPRSSQSGPSLAISVVSQLRMK